MSEKPESKRILPRLKGLSQFPRRDANKDANKSGSNDTGTNGNGSNGTAGQTPSRSENPALASSLNGEGPSSPGTNGSANGPTAPRVPVEQQVVVVSQPAESKPQNCWQRFMNQWPKGLQRQGVIITNWDEQVPFSSFLTNDDLVMFERRNPDTNGARRLLIGYAAIKAIKIVEVVKDAPFLESGFAGPVKAGGE